MFFELSPNKLKAHSKAFQLKQKREREKTNYNLWLNGIYMMNAIGACFSKDSKYPKKPIDMYSDKSKEEIEADGWERFKCAFASNYVTDKD